MVFPIPIKPARTSDIQIGDRILIAFNVNSCESRHMHFLGASDIGFALLRTAFRPPGAVFFWRK